MPLPSFAERQTVVVGDDWQLVMNLLNGVAAADVSSYTPFANLNGPGSMVTALTGDFDVSAASTGTVTLTVPSSLTSTLAPDDTSYRVQFGLVDPYGHRQTYLVIPLKVLST